MTKLLRDKGTNLFLTKGGGWTDDVSEAWRFTGRKEIDSACQAMNLKDVELYYSFVPENLSEFDFTLPL